MKRTEKGFTLIEVMLALSILGFGLLSVAAMQLNAIRGSAFAAGLSEATEGTQQAIELQLSIPYASMATGNDTITGPRGTALTRTWTVANPTADYATITATTTYVDEMANNRTISLTTVRARN